MRSGERAALFGPTVERQRAGSATRGSGSYVIITIVEFIKAHREEIIAEWISVADSLTPRDLTDDELRDAVHEILDSIVHAMGSADASRRENVLTGHPVATAELADVGKTHAAHRFTQRFTLKQMAAEYRALRANVTRRWLAKRKGKRAPQGQLAQQLAVFNAAVDWSLTSAIDWYDDRLRRQQEELKIADRNKNEFLAVLGHELRNPLAPLRTGLELLDRARTKPELLDTLQPMMERQFSHLSRLVDDLLDFARISRGDISLQLAPINLNVVIETAVEQVVTPLREKRHDLRLHLSETPLTVLGDFDRLTQVIANLLSNSGKYSNPGSSITVTSQKERARAVVRVADTGYGIPAEDLERIFELFTQISEHRRRTGGGGLGIGLALSRRLVAMHHGSLEASSVGLGHGSEFVVTLPLAEEAPTPMQIDVEGTKDPPSTPLRILIVDDNKDAADSLAVMLQQLGHDALTAHDSETAVAEAAVFKPDVAFVDVGLPQLDGVELGLRLKSSSDTQNVVLVAVTGWNQDHDRERTSLAGFSGHLVKPVTFRHLRDLLARLSSSEIMRNGR